MNIIITGATGTVGQLAIPQFMAMNCTLLIVGRDIPKLSQMYPDCDACTYEDLPVRGAGFDKLVHLAVANNDTPHTRAEYHDVNVTFLLQIAEMAKAAQIRKFINISSVHGLDPQNLSDYAISKREASKALSEMDGLSAETIYLPAVYGHFWAGKLSILNKMWRPAAKIAFLILAALKPTVHIDKLVAHITADKPVASSAEIILFDDQDNNPVYSVTTRLIDILFAVSVALLLGWVLAIVWIAIRAGSPGPGLFVQTRVGKNGKNFKCYKFRTMQTGTKQAGTHEVSAASITKIGIFLRKTKIDELPQIWNIFRNEISLIGPRPCLLNQEELIQARQDLGVLNIKPGISGLGQINNIDMSTPNKLAHIDKRYYALRSLLLDLKILIATVTGKGQGDKIKTG